MNNDKPDCEIKEISDDLKLLEDYVQIWTSVSSLSFVLCALVNKILVKFKIKFWFVPCWNSNIFSLSHFMQATVKVSQKAGCKKCALNISKYS